MRFRKRLRNIFVLVWIIGLTSCIPAAGQEEQPAATSAETATLTITRAPEKTITPTLEPPLKIPDQILPGEEISFWHAWSGDRANWIEGITENFNNDNEWGIQVNMESRADDSVLLENINQALEIGLLPDLVATQPYVLNLFFSQGIPIQDLNLYINSTQWGISEQEINEIPVVYLKAGQQGDELTGMPASRTGYVLFYNQSWARELGFNQIPSTVEEFRDQACAAARSNLSDRDPNNNGTGGLFYQNSPEAMLSWMESFGGGFGNDTDNRIIFESEGNRIGLEFLYDLYHSDCAWVGRETRPYRYFAERYALFYSGNLQDIIIQSSMNQTSGSRDEWTIIPYPSGGFKPVMLLDGHSYGILAEDSQKALATWVFIKYMLEADNQVDQVMQFAELPISISVLDQTESLSGEFPAWRQAVDLLPIASNMPASSDWGIARSLLQDIANQLILFTTNKEDIPVLLQSADTIMQEMDQSP